MTGVLFPASYPLAILAASAPSVATPALPSPQAEAATPGFRYAS